MSAMFVMKNGLYYRLLLLTCCLVACCTCANAQNDFCNTVNNSFQEGEKITFRVYYNMSFIWATAGYATFTVKTEDMNGRKVYHVTGDGKTAKSYEWFYKVRDIYESYIDKETLLPLRFVRNVNEGGFKIFADVKFDRNKKEAVNEKKKKYAITDCTQDVLSAIYFARNIDYNKHKPGDKIPFSMFLDDSLYSVYIKYLGKEEMQTRNGKYKCIKIVPLLIEGTMFKGGEKMTIWVSDDDNHIPVRIESPILIGSIKVDLVEHENLKNPFTSMISER